MRGAAGSLFARFASIGADPGDSETERLRKGVLVFLCTIVLVPAVLWGLAYIALGVPGSGAIPLGYGVFSAASLAVFARTKRWAFFRTSQLVLILLLPFLLQWSLGGFVASSAVMLWALLAPVGALMFAGARAARRWLYAYLALAAVSGLADSTLAESPAALPEGVRNAFFVTNLGAVSAIVFYVLSYFTRSLERAHESLRDEHEKAESLLLNVLPPAIAARLKARPGTIADRFHDVTVLFSDIVGFTPLSTRYSPEQLVGLLDEVFSEFDALAERHGLEKIKTIGDAYMAAAGLPDPRPDHAEAVADMALGMIDVVRRVSRARGVPLEVRVGLNSGSVVAGVIGRKKFIYDLWGDAVNTASRMESHGLPGSVQVTRDTYELLKDRFDLEPRGEIDVKGKGPMPTWLLKGRLDPLPARASTSPVPRSG